MEKFTTSIDLGYEPLSEEEQEKARFKVISNEPNDSIYEDEKQEKVHYKKGALRFYFLNFFLGVVIVLIGGFICAVSLFELKNIEYEGLVNANAADLKEALFSAPHTDNTLYAFGYNLVKENDPIPFVRDVNVYIKDKNTLVVSVKEDELYGYIPLKGEYIYFDSEGVITQISKKLVANVPEVKGLKPEEPAEYSELNVQKSQINAVTNLIKYLRGNYIVPQQIVFEKDGTFGFFMDNVFIDLGIPSNLREKCERLPYILPSIMGQKGILHLEEWARENTDIIFEKTN